MNPRVLAFLRAHGLTPADVERKSPNDELLKIDGTPWTVEFIIWIQQQWVEWAKAHGHASALEARVRMAGADDAFDAWLAREVTP